MSDLNGNPNKTNDLGETSLHCVCSVESVLTNEQKKCRLECLTLLLDWKGVGEQPEIVNLAAVDSVSIPVFMCNYTENCSVSVVVS